MHVRYGSVCLRRALALFCILLRNLASGLPPAVERSHMINNDGKILNLMGYPPDGVISFGDRETGYGLSAGRTASVQPPLSKTAAAETTAAGLWQYRHTDSPEIPPGTPEACSGC